jgi:hypothetical protein
MMTKPDNENIMTHQDDYTFPACALPRPSLPRSAMSGLLADRL